MNNGFTARFERPGFDGVSFVRHFICPPNPSVRDNLKVEVRHIAADLGLHVTFDSATIELWPIEPDYLRASLRVEVEQICAG
ncbi:MAG: hypothetical protein HYW51_03935 [Candidatus Doudnabacteria bacterium]|nr:hypothetical protein [Candidatus Doudnabacteria bacterium]